MRNFLKWTCIVFFGIVAINAMSPSSSDNKARASTSSSPGKSSTDRAIDKAVKSLNEWAVFTHVDEMTGKKWANAQMKSLGFPADEMNFPYNDTHSRIIFGCNGKSEWLLIKFNNAPNLNNTETKDGYDRIVARVRYDDALDTATLTQTWGEARLNFVYPAANIKRIMASKQMRLELSWHGESSKTVFFYSLGGSSQGISEARKVCAAA